MTTESKPNVTIAHATDATTTVRNGRRFERGSSPKIPTVNAPTPTAVSVMGTTDLSNAGLLKSTTSSPFVTSEVVRSDINQQTFVLFANPATPARHSDSIVMTTNLSRMGWGSKGRSGHSPGSNGAGARIPYNFYSAYLGGGLF